tara:strand:- start:1748 stop:2749 length:1002 start_codon:yes stop_codon:yes gene_type:complete
MADLSLMDKYKNDPFARFRANRNNPFIQDIINTPRTDGTPRQVALPPQLPPAQNVPFADKAQQIAAQAMMNTPGLIDQGAGVPGQDYNRPASFGEEAINKGAQAGLLTSNIDNVKSLFDRVLDRGVQSLGQPAQFGGNFVTEQARGELALQANEAATAKAQQEAALKAAEIAGKNAPKQGKLTSEVNNLYSKFQGASRRIDSANKIKQILTKSAATGGAGAIKNGIVNLAAAFNINLGKTAGQDVDFLLAKLKRQMIASRIFGRETNKQEQELIDKLLPTTGVFTNIGTIMESVDSEIRSAEKDAQDASGVLRNFGYTLPSQFKKQSYEYRQD